MHKNPATRNATYIAMKMKRLKSSPASSNSDLSDFINDSIKKSKVEGRSTRILIDSRPCRSNSTSTVRIKGSISNPALDICVRYEFRNFTYHAKIYYFSCALIHILASPWFFKCVLSAMSTKLIEELPILLNLWEYRLFLLMERMNTLLLPMSIRCCRIRVFRAWFRTDWSQAFETFIGGIRSYSNSYHMLSLSSINYCCL